MILGERLAKLKGGALSGCSLFLTKAEAESGSILAKHENAKQRVRCSALPRSLLESGFPEPATCDVSTSVNLLPNLEEEIR